MSTADEIGFRAATEAVIGLTLRGEKPTLENVREWISTAIDLNVPTRDIGGRAMYFAERMLNGPIRPDGSAG